MLVKLVKDRKAYYYVDAVFESRRSEIELSLERGTYLCRRLAHLILDLDENKFEKCMGTIENLLDSVIPEPSAKAPQG